MGSGTFDEAEALDEDEEVLEDEELDDDDDDDEDSDSLARAVAARRAGERSVRRPHCFLTIWSIWRE